MEFNFPLVKKKKKKENRKKNENGWKKEKRIVQHMAGSYLRFSYLLLWKTIMRYCYNIRYNLDISSVTLNLTC